MAHKFPRPDFLTNEEIDYELIIRGREEDVHDTLDAKQRLLRKLFHDDMKEKRNYRGKCAIELEFDYIMRQVEDIAKILEDGCDERCMARLKHYALRTERSITRGPQDEQLRNRLEGEIKKLLNKFGSFQDSENENTKKDEETQKEKRKGEGDETQEEKKAEEVKGGNSEGKKNNGNGKDWGPVRGETLGKEALSDKEKTKNKGAIPKDTLREKDKEKGKEKEKEEETKRLKQRIVQLERELYRLAQIAEDRVEKQLQPKESGVSEHKTLKEPEKTGNNNRRSEAQRHPRDLRDQMSKGHSNGKQDWYDGENSYDEDRWSDSYAPCTGKGLRDPIRYKVNRTGDSIPRDRDRRNQSPERSIGQSRYRHENKEYRDNRRDSFDRLDEFANRTRNRGNGDRFRYQEQQSPERLDDRRDRSRYPDDYRRDPVERLDEFANRTRDRFGGNRDPHFNSLANPYPNPRPDRGDGWNDQNRRDDPPRRPRQRVAETDLTTADR